MNAEVIRLPTGYEPVREDMERPVKRGEIARAFGVSTRTVDRWVVRGMPQDTPMAYGCWVQVGAHRRFYPSRVRAWLGG